MSVSDDEWEDFYGEFIKPFNACLPNYNQMIIQQNLFVSFQKTDISKLDAF